VRWTPGTVASDGEDIYFEVTEPDGDVVASVVLGHGAGSCHASWFQVVPRLAAAGYRTITWDTRGFGCSTLRQRQLGVDDAVADLLAVLDATRTATAHIVGQSMGGWWACGFALAHPDRTQSLTLANTAGGVWTDALRDHFAQWATSGRGLDTSEELGRHNAVGPTLVHRDPALAFLYQQLNTLQAPPMDLVGAAIMGTRHAPAAVRALPCPKLWITASDDQLFPPALIHDAATQVGARVAEIADAGHSPYFERPAEWTDAFLGGAAHAH
jgi:pimeloyl-ACP methyl ester carboxylesterase